MNARNFADLVEVIGEFLGNSSEADRGAGLVDDGLAEQMAKAAAAVYDGSMNGQKYFGKEN